MSEFEQWIQNITPKVYLNGVHLPYRARVLERQQSVVMYPDLVEYGMNRLWSHTDKGWRSEYDHCHPDRICGQYKPQIFRPPDAFVNAEPDESREPRYVFVFEASTEIDTIKSRIETATNLYVRTPHDKPNP